MIDKLRDYEEYHFEDVKDIGVAFDGCRVWVCLNGIALLRAKNFAGGLSVEFYEPEEYKRRKAAAEKQK